LGKKLPVDGRLGIVARQQILLYRHPAHPFGLGGRAVAVRVFVVMMLVSVVVLYRGAIAFTTAGAAHRWVLFLG
jgi:hypothetical protein